MKYTTNQILDIVRKVGAEADLEKLEADTALTDIGLDSLDIFDILLEVQELAGIEIPDDDVEKLNSVSSICEYLETIK